MTKLRMSYEDKVLCGLVLDPGMSLKMGVEDEKKSDEALLSEGFVSDEEVGTEHALPAALSESQLQSCMDPLDYALKRRDSEHYGSKTLTRNTRLA